MDISTRFFTPPRQSYFLFGPRGTGKSTWLKHIYPTALWIDLLLPETERTYKARPERLIEAVSALPCPRTVVLDEIQRAPELLPVVHSLMEEKRGTQFVLTGSSARKLKRAGVDLLGGRALIQTFHPFMAAELGARFDFAAALQYGLLPVTLASETPIQTLNAYHILYLKEEVQMEGLVRNIGAFSRFLEAAAFSHGGVLNRTNVSRDCEINAKVVESYFTILEDLLLAFRVPVFAKRAKRRTSLHPKFYYFDAGVFRSLRQSGPLDRPGEIDGQALEGLVAQHLRAWMEWGGKSLKLYFWRTQAGSEVDFILYGGEGFWAIEVKNGATIHPQDLRPLKAFRDDYPECRPILLYRGREALIRDGILCRPCDDFLKRLRPGDDFPEG